MFYVYVLQSLKNNRFYTGSTDNLERRLHEHNSGLSKYTKSTRPFKLMYFEMFDNRSDAIKREKYFKTGKGREELREIIRVRSSVG